MPTVETPLIVSAPVWSDDGARLLLTVASREAENRVGFAVVDGAARRTTVCGGRRAVDGFPVRAGRSDVGFGGVRPHRHPVADLMTTVESLVFSPPPRDGGMPGPAPRDLRARTAPGHRRGAGVVQRGHADRAGRPSGARRRRHDGSRTADARRDRLRPADRSALLLIAAYRSRNLSPRQAVPARKRRAAPTAGAGLRGPRPGRRAPPAQPTFPLAVTPSPGRRSSTRPSSGRSGRRRTTGGRPPRRGR